MPSQTAFIERAVLVGTLLAVLAPQSAHASFLEGDALDTMANGISWLVLVLVPIGLLILFWTLHVMPEKIAAERHHPQKEAIHTLCLLSLAFGGLLWPFAWLWTYTRPVGYKLAYGTDKHDDYYIKNAEQASDGNADPDHAVQLLEELGQLEAKGNLSPELKRIRDRLVTTRGTG
jgi:hypothetical protein